MIIIKSVLESFLEAPLCDLVKTKMRKTQAVRLTNFIVVLQKGAANPCQLTVILRC